ncbi:unnamed protein product [Leuciscus chuanchicus]
MIAHRVLVYCSVADYEKARQKAKKAETSSRLNSENDTMLGKCNRKRKPNPWYPDQRYLKGSLSVPPSPLSTPSQRISPAPYSPCTTWPTRTSSVKKADSYTNRTSNNFSV